MADNVNGIDHSDEEDVWDKFNAKVDEFAGQPWIDLKQKKEKEFVAESWDYPLSKINAAYKFKSVPIADRQFQRQLTDSSTPSLSTTISTTTTLSAGHVAGSPISKTTSTVSYEPRQDPITTVLRPPLSTTISTPPRPVAGSPIPKTTSTVSNEPRQGPTTTVLKPSLLKSPVSNTAHLTASPRQASPFPFPSLGPMRMRLPTANIEPETTRLPRLSDLKYAKSLEDIKTAKEAVYVTHFYGFNKVHIMTARNFKNDFIILKEDIFESLQTSSAEDTSILVKPDIGSVVLAPFETYHLRAVVEEIHFGVFVVVRFFDVGPKARLHLKELRRISKEIIDMPILGQEVLLNGVLDDEPMILRSDFETFTSKWLQTRSCLLTSVESHSDVVRVGYDIHSVKKDLSQQILNLGKWKWEQKWETTPGINEDILCRATTWSRPEEEHIRKLRPGHSIKVTVASSDVNTGELTVLLNIETEDYMRDRKVLQQQLDRFVKIVPGEDFFPILGENILLKILPNNDKKLKAVKGVGKWNRCHRGEKNFLINPEVMELYPLSSDLKHMMVFRRYCPDFGRVPWFCLHCTLKGCETMSEVKKNIFSQVMAVGNVITIQALDEDPCFISCLEFDQT